MPWETTGDLDAFLAAAGGFLRSRPAQHTLLLTVAETLRVGGLHAFGPASPRFGWWRAQGGVDGAFLQTPPHPPLLTGMPADAVPRLGDVLAARALDGLNGPAGLAEAVAARLDVEVRLHRRERLYRLGALTPPDRQPPGRAVLADRSLREQLIAWFTAFEAETGEPGGDAAARVDERLSHDGLHVWEAPDGAAAAMAATSRLVVGMMRVSAVYTPPERRRQGLAAAVTAAASRSALDAGATDVLLFTDLANPTTNRIYQQIGYRPVEDRVSLRFAPRGGRAAPGAR